MRRAARQDGNQAQIVRALRRVGIAVEVIGKPLDLLCCVRGATVLVEVKNPDGANRLTKAQIAFKERWPGKIYTVRSVDDAIAQLLAETMK